jgi:hypothetical protein
MPLTPTPLYCPNCDCQQLKTRKSYTLKGGAVRQLYRCPECQHCFSETHDTPLANLKTPLSPIVLILQALSGALMKGWGSTRFAVYSMWAKTVSIAGKNA